MDSTRVLKPSRPLPEIPDSGYEVVEMIAQGGMAELFLGYQRKRGLDKPVAIKRMRPEHVTDGTMYLMFLEEARIAITLQHPNIVQTYDVLESGQEVYIVMEMLQGVDLGKILRWASRSEEPISLERSITIMLAVLAGLHYAHEHRSILDAPLDIVHRDVSPPNIFLTVDGMVKLLDFGIAKAANPVSPVTTVGILKGKVPYMSPEQCLGRPVDRRSDVFSAGVVLYETCCGARPFVGETDYLTMQAIVGGTAPRPRERNEGIPAGLEQIILTSLAPRREDRYPTARAFQSALEAFAREHGYFSSPIGLSGLVAAVKASGLAEPERRTLSDVIALENRVVEERLASSNLDETRTTSGSMIGARVKDSSTSSSRSSVALGSVAGATTIIVGSKIDESFHGEPLGQKLHGTVLFYLKDLWQFTSFGVREWLQMIDAMAPNVTHAWFSECSEAFTNQVSMIPAILGKGKIISAYATYLCRACRKEFPVLVKADEVHASLSRGSMGERPCPRCGGESTFDDDLEYWRGFQDQFAAAVPGDVSAMAAELGAHGSGHDLIIEKRVEGRSTYIALGCDLDERVRWARVLDGLEGDIRLSLSEVGQVTDFGVQKLFDALRKLASNSSVSLVSIQGCPAEAFQLLSKESLTGVEVTSIRRLGRCAHCGTERYVDCTTAAASESSRFDASCRSCGRLLELDPLDPLDPLGGGDELATLATESETETEATAEAEAPIENPGPASRSSARASATPRPPAIDSPNAKRLVFLVLLMLAAFVGALWLSYR